MYSVEPLRKTQTHGMRQKMWFVSPIASSDLQVLYSNLTSTQSLQFSIRMVVASGNPVHHNYPHVLRLTIHMSLWARAVRAVQSTLLLTLGLNSVFPEWSLPDNVILKMQKNGHEENFDAERSAYDKLACLQGHVIPVLFGQIDYNGTYALLLSDTRGSSMAEPEGILLEDGDVLSETELQNMLYQTLGTIAAFRLSQDDIKRDHFRRVDHLNGRAIMVVDLERVGEVTSVEEERIMKKTAVTALLREYKRHVQFMRDNGLLVS